MFPDKVVVVQRRGTGAGVYSAFPVSSATRALILATRDSIAKFD
jgi:hypothetical protein